MNTRHSFSCAAVLAWVALPAWATSGFSPVHGEAGLQTHVMRGSNTRAQLQQELADWQRNPTSADGWKWINGEPGWSFVGIPERPAVARTGSAPPTPGSVR